MEPSERIKKLASYSDTFEVDPSIPARRYYRSGLEMVRMANVYLDEGNLECAYVLYVKFMTLFIEKIRKHPDFTTVSANVKQTITEKLKEIMPKAEKLKGRLIELYSREYNQKLEQERKEKEEVNRLMKKAKELDDERLKQKLKAQIDKDQHKNGAINVVKPISIDTVQYPDDSSVEVKIKPSAPVLPEPEIVTQPKPLLPDPPSVPPSKSSIPVPNSLLLPSSPGTATPSFDRNTKPSSLLSPSIASKPLALRTVIIPSRLMPSFLNISHRNTSNNVETCGVLAGKLERDHLIITHMIVPKQKGTPDSCVTMNEEELFDFQDQHNLITLGWIHTHPTQTAFLSSIDLHTHCSYQTMMPEAIAIVCAPKYEETGYFMLTADHGLSYISSCRGTGFHPHPKEPPLFKHADHTRIESSAYVEVVDLRN